MPDNRHIEPFTPEWHEVTSEVRKSNPKTLTAVNLAEMLHAAGDVGVRIDGKPLKDVLMPYGGPVNLVSKRRWWRRRSADA